MRTWLRSLQHPCGGFSASLVRDETDLRFSYCACVAAELINVWDAIDVKRLLDFIQTTVTWEGAFSLIGEGSEAHGGATFTAVASLALMLRFFQRAIANDDPTIHPDFHNFPQYIQQINEMFTHDGPLTKWILMKQGGDGYRGRVNKPW